MWYVVVDNFMGGCVLFDNIEDCKRFIKEASDDYDPDDFTVYVIEHMNMNYNTYMNRQVETATKS